MASSGKLRKRGKIPEADKWDLSPIFPSVKEWEKELASLTDAVAPLAKFKGKLAGNPDNIANYFRLLDRLELRLERLSVYAHLMQDEDLNRPEPKIMNEKISNLSSKISQMTAYAEPEILSMDKKDLEALLEYPALEFARVPLRELIRSKDHYLSEKEERLMAMASRALGAPYRIFSYLNDADLKFPPIKDENGNETELTHGRYIGFMKSPNRRVRKEAFTSLYSTYNAFKNTLAATLDSHFKVLAFSAKARSFGSIRKAALHDDEVPEEVYDNLIDTVREYLPAMYRYVELRKKALDLDELHMYDVYVPLVGDVDRNVPFDSAVEIVMKALEPLGEEVSSIVQEGMTSRWIDKYENVGKRSGAYSSGAYGTPPYILLNYDNKINDVFTLAHEMGHSVHTYLANKNQPHITADYRIMVAEVASTVNEVLLLEHLKKEWTDEKERAYLINHHLEDFRGTVFRQTMFAEFERDVAKLADQETPITPELLNEMYYKLNKDYFGDRMTVDNEIAVEWARIPHFYYDLYVYKYATGYSSAMAFARTVLSGDSNGTEAYINMLKSGGSRPPLDLLKSAGVDLRTPAPIRSALDVFASEVKELEKCLDI